MGPKCKRENPDKREKKGKETNPICGLDLTLPLAARARASLLGRDKLGDDDGLNKGDEDETYEGDDVEDFALGFATTNASSAEDTENISG